MVVVIVIVVVVIVVVAVVVVVVVAVVVIVLVVVVIVVVVVPYILVYKSNPIFEAKNTTFLEKVWFFSFHQLNKINRWSGIQG